MKLSLSFDDVLIVPSFSQIASRADVDVSTRLMDLNLKLPIISSNMDSVTEKNMAVCMWDNGGVGCLHRFMPIKDNAYMYQSIREDKRDALVSVGVGTNELERFKTLLDAGAERFVLDVANGANMNVVNQVRQMREIGGSKFQLMVGNFATGRSITSFLYQLGDYKVDAFKVGVGGGSACITRTVSGCGMPTFASILDCSRETNIPIIADGGIRNSADLAKALGAGAKAVMIGGLLAGTDESPGKLVNSSGYEIDEFVNTPNFKKYRGSASAESYKAQRKEAAHRAPEGESFLVPYTGSASSILQTLEAGLRGSLSTVGASNLEQFKECVEFIQITPNGVKENSAHGKK